MSSVSIVNVAQYLLQKDNYITTMKLQKLCFYSQAYSLIKLGKPLFPQEFQAWKNGPVARELWNLHAGYYFAPIQNIGKYDGSLSKEQKEIVDKVFQELGPLSGGELSIKAHKEDPWLNARKGIDPEQNCEEVISIENIKKAYTLDSIFAH